MTMAVQMMLASDTDSDRDSAEKTRASKAFILALTRTRILASCRPSLETLLASLNAGGEASSVEWSPCGPSLYPA